MRKSFPATAAKTRAEFSRAPYWALALQDVEHTGMIGARSHPDADARSIACGELVTAGKKDACPQECSMASSIRKLSL